MSIIIRTLSAKSSTKKRLNSLTRQRITDLVMLDVIDSPCGLGASFGPESGVGLLSASCFNVFVAAHELGHAFGLAHDHFRPCLRGVGASYHTDWMVTSFCAAEWLDAHRYFRY